MIIDVFELEKVVGESKQQWVGSNEGRRLDGRVHRTALIINSSTLYHAFFIRILVNYCCTSSHFQSVRRMDLSLSFSEDVYEWWRPEDAANEGLGTPGTNGKRRCNCYSIEGDYYSTTVTSGSH